MSPAQQVGDRMVDEDVYTLWPHRWVTAKAMRVPSAIHGMGLAAIEAIAEAEPIMVFGGVIVPRNDIPRYRTVVGNYDYPIDDDFSIALPTRRELADTGALNHSCEPNVGWRNALVVVAMRPIDRDEELTSNYACFGGYTAFECNCGSESCKGRVAPSDWKDPETQRRYGHWFTPFMRSKAGLG